MGCWEETCALTNTPIYNGERCVMIVIDEDKLKSLFKNFSGAVTIGTMGGDYQWKIFKSLHCGTYNDYGYLEELDESELGKSFPCIFFHEAVWDWALKNSGRLPKYCFEADIEKGPYGSDLVVEDWLRDVARVCRFALTLRRNILSGLCFQGCQESGIEKHKFELVELTKNVLLEHKRRFTELAAEYKDDDFGDGKCAVR